MHVIFQICNIYQVICWTASTLFYYEIISRLLRTTEYETEGHRLKNGLIKKVQTLCIFQKTSLPINKNGCKQNYKQSLIENHLH